MTAVLLGVLAALCWSVHDVLARGIAGPVGAFRVAALVMVTGGILLTGFVLHNATLWNAPREAIEASVLLGLAYGFGVGGLFKSFSLGPVSLVGPVTAGYPILAVLWGIFNGLEPTLLQWTCVAATLVGAVVVARSGTEDGGINAVAPGNLPKLLFFMGLCMLGYSAFIVLGQRAGLMMGEVEATWISRPVSLLVLVPFVLADGPHPAPSRRQWLGIIAMGVLDVIGVVLVNSTGAMPGAGFVGIGISAYGALAVVLAMIFLGEKVSRGQWLGMALIAFGIATLSLAQP